MCSNINKIKHYLIEVKNVSPLRIGNGEDDGNGLLMLDNHAVISGTTLAGLFRDFISKEKEVKEDNIIYKLLFSSEIKYFEGNEEKSYRNTSKIYFYDAISNENADKGLICRNHVHINEKLSVSEDEHLFKEYHISQGVTFKLTFEVRGLEIKENEYEKICNYLEEFILFIANGKLPVGSKSTVGFGVLKAEREKWIYCKEYNLLEENDFRAYLSLESILEKDMNQVEIKSIKNKSVEIIFKGYCEDGVIIKGNRDEEYNSSGKGKPKKVEASYKEYIDGKEKFLIPSSTIKGIVRGYSKKIYRTIGKEIGEIADIFGKKANGDNEKAIRGKITFKDCEINESEMAVYNRIKIDRFTGGAMDGDLFSEKLVIIPEEKAVEFIAMVDEEYKKAIALIILAFRDIGLGYLTVGSGNNVGYGRFKGKSITINENDSEKWKVQFKEGSLEDVIKGSLEEFEKLVKLLNEE